MSEQERYFLSHPVFGEKEVTREEWVKAERQAGFRPPCLSDNPRYWTEPATGGFYSNAGVSGRIEYISSSTTKNYKPVIDLKDLETGI